AAGRYAARLYLDVQPSPGPGLLAAAMAELLGGSAERAAEYAARAVRASMSAGDEDWLKVGLVTSGLVQVLRGDAPAAAAAFGRAWAIEQRLSRVDPGIFLWHADFVESLAGTGAKAEAAAVLAEVSGHAERLHRQVALLGLERASATLVAAGGDARGGADRLAAAIERWAEHPYPLELARAWHALAGLERRAPPPRAARAALVAAGAPSARAAAGAWRPGGCPE